MLLSEISLPLALQDLMLVVFFAIGLFFVGKIVSRECLICGKLAYFSGFLITLGGFFKVCWKLIMATTETDIAWLNNSLFVLMSVGFIGLSWALWRSKKDNSPINYWLLPVILVFLTLGIAAYFAFVKETRTWFFVLLGATTIFNLATSLQLIVRSWQKKLWIAVILFSFNVFCYLGLSRLSDQTVTLQWIKQAIGTASLGSFAIASWLLFKSIKKLQ
jgi:hypothetical protein